MHTLKAIVAAIIASLIGTLGVSCSTMGGSGMHHLADPPSVTAES
jgi:hypothetical protein